MHGSAIGADFFEMWSDPDVVPRLTSVPSSVPPSVPSSEPAEPNDRPFTIMPPAGHLIRVIDIYPPAMGGKPTVMHRTRTLDYVVVIEGEVVLILEDSEVLLKKSDVVVQRGTNHAWENRSDKMARMVFFHIDGQFSEELLAKLPTPLDLMT
jgi:mannose-6-phosphate isomerase-like protein (cupin superfamily)